MSTEPAINSAQFTVLQSIKQQTEKERQVVILRRWYIHPLSHDPAHPSLGGNVENHPRLGSGKNCRTTPCSYLNETLGIAVTKNTVYILKDKL